MVAKRWVLVWGLLSLTGCGDSSTGAPQEGEDLEDHGLDGGGADASVRADSGGPPDGNHGRDAGDVGSDSGDGVDAGEVFEGADTGVESDAGLESDAEAEPGVPVSDPQNTGFLAYGQLRLAFKGPIDATGVTVTISPARPTGIAVVQVAQAGTNALLVTLSLNHLPVDYTATVSGAGYSVEVLIPGAGNGSRSAFASSHTGSGDLRTWIPAAGQATSGRAAGDIICQSEADAAGLKGTFRALLSSSQAGDPYDAACRALDRTGKWVDHCGLSAEPEDAALIIDQDGLPLAQGAEAIAQGAWLLPFRYYADGQSNDPGNHGWTGSTEDGRAASGNCVGFTSALKTDRASASAQVPNYLLNAQYSLDCTSSLQIVCVQTGTNFFATSTVHKQTGKAVFITPTSFSPSSQDAAAGEADALCQAAAKDAGYATHANFVAWLSSSTSLAVCRLAGGSEQKLDRCGLSSWPQARWVRPDGLVVANGIPELLSGRVRAPVLFTPDGSRGGSNLLVQTYTGSNGAYATCNAGHAGSVPAWTQYMSQCAARPIMCFER